MSSRLLDVARSTQRPPAAAEERCDFCAAPVPPRHRHVLDLERRAPLCVCRACALLFDRPAAGGEHYRLIPDHVVRLDGFRLDDAMWDSLRIPVDMAFFSHSSAAGRVVARYPGPLGVTESLLELDEWRALEAANPVLSEMQPDVEALLVNRSRGAREHWLVGLDECYSLAAVMRTHWRGLGGGTEVWKELDRFFAWLREHARPARPTTKEATWQT